MTISVCAALVLAFVITGFVASAYKRERRSLGEMHYERGQALASQGKSEDAIDEYREALLFAPDRTEYRLSLVRALIRAHRLDEAESHLEQLVEEDPTNAYNNLLLARIAAMRKKTQEAIDYYQRAVYEYWPLSDIAERRAARWELTNLLSKTGRRSEMTAELIQLYASSPPDPDERLKIAFLLLKNGATSEAARIFSALMREFPHREEAYRGMGEVYFSGGDYVAARHEFQRALKLNSKDRDSAQELAFTNTLIDIDPALPNISGRERFRRSQNLLNRVLTDLGQCSANAPLSDAVQQRIDGARKLLATKNTGDDDVSDQLQDAAQGLWKDRGQFCGGTAIADRALETVLPRVAND